MEIFRRVEHYIVGGNVGGNIISSVEMSVVTLYRRWKFFVKFFVGGTLYPSNFSSNFSSVEHYIRWKFFVGGNMSSVEIFVGGNRRWNMSSNIY